MTVHYLGDPKFRAFDSNGLPLSGGKLHTFEEGTATPKASFSDSTGTVSNPNPVVLDAAGRAEVWLDGKYKLRLDNSIDSLQWTMDGVSGVGFVAAASAITEWTPFTDSTPDFIDATNFSVAGDKRATFQENRRVRVTVTAGTLYGLITASVFTSLTTVTVVLDSGSLDSGLSAAAVGFISVNNQSVHYKAIDGLEATFSKPGQNDSFASGTRMLFNQTVPPTGWTKAAENNKALRLTTGSVGGGGTVDFTTAFKLQDGQSAAHQLTVAEMPAHSHEYLGIEGGLLSGGGGFAGDLVQTDVIGGDTAHSHALDLDLAVQYVDVILAEKD